MEHRAVDVRDDSDGPGHRDGQRLHVLLAAVARHKRLGRHVVVESVEGVDESLGDAGPDDVRVGLDSAPLNVSDVLSVAAPINVLK